MELPHIGSQCDFSECKQMDFLPFSCDRCHQTFCLDHRTYKSHFCTVTVDKTAPTCPLCNQILFVKSNEDANVVIGRHMDLGCPKEENKVTFHGCTMEGCKKKEILPYNCKFCQLPFCGDHRIPEIHQCKVVCKNNSKEIESRHEYKEMFSNMLQFIKSKFQTTKKDDPKAKTMMKVKYRNAAKGDTKIPNEQRLYLEVILPSESKKDSFLMFFDKRHTIGRAIDSIANLSNIENRNHLQNSRKLKLVHVDQEMIMNSGNKISTELEDGDVVLLEYEDIIHI